MSAVYITHYARFFRQQHFKNSSFPFGNQAKQNIRSKLWQCELTSRQTFILTNWNLRVPRCQCNRSSLLYNINGELMFGGTLPVYTSAVRCPSKTSFCSACSFEAPISELRISVLDLWQLCKNYLLADSKDQTFVNEMTAVVRVYPVYTLVTK